MRSLGPYDANYVNLRTAFIVIITLDVVFVLQNLCFWIIVDADVLYGNSTIMGELAIVLLYDSVIAFLMILVLRRPAFGIMSMVLVDKV